MSPLANNGERKAAKAVRDVPTPSLKGVQSQRTSDPVDPPAVDRQRLFKGTGGNIGMLNKTGPQAPINRKRASRKRY